MGTIIPVHKSLIWNENEPEISKMHGRELRLSATEWCRRTFNALPEVQDFGSVEESVKRLGRIARSIATGRHNDLDVVKLYHPSFPEGVNGWPANIWEQAWHRLTVAHGIIRWQQLPPLAREVPETPHAAPYNPRLWDQLQQAAESRRPTYRSDQRWQAALQMLNQDRQMGESAEQAMIRRNSATAAMFMIEKEYEGR